MLQMVEDVLRDKAPDDAVAERVFQLLCAYPTNRRLFGGQTVKSLAKIGAAGKEGFIRILNLPHARSRLMAVHYLGREYRGDGPPKDFGRGFAYKIAQ